MLMWLDARGSRPDIGEIEIERNEHSILALTRSADLGIRVTVPTLVKNRFDVVAGCREAMLRHPAKVLVQLEPDSHPSGLSRDWDDAFAEPGEQRRRVQQECAQVSTTGTAQGYLRRLSTRKIIENNRHGDPRASEAHSSVHDLRVGSDVWLPVHSGNCVHPLEYSTMLPFVPN